MERSNHFRRHHHHHHHNRRQSPSPGLPSKDKKATHQPRHDALKTHATHQAMDRDSYVESWLQQTRAPGQEHATHSEKGPEISRSKTTSRRLGCAESEDSSIILRNSHHLAHIPAHHRPLDPRDNALRHTKNQQKTTKKRKRSTRSVESHANEILEQERDRYEKRARHKTREDKYETNHGGPTHRKPVEGESKTKIKHMGGREKEKGREKKKKKKYGLATAKELMGKFSSDAIHNDRLTMLPSMQVGMFRNSKTDKAPGDLTFGEMAFLKEAKPQEVTKTAPKTKSLESKKRDQKELENIEVFFSHKKHDGDGFRSIKETGHEETAGRESKVRANMPGSVGDNSRVSAPSRATTYFSWSSSDHRSEHQARPAERPIRSPKEERPIGPRTSCSRVETRTPESIRRKLTETGIYRCLSRSGHTRPRSEQGSQRHFHGEQSHEPRYLKDHDAQATTSGAPLSRAFIAQQAYIKPKWVIPQLSPSGHVLPSTEHQTPSEHAPLPDSPTGTQHPPSTQDPSPKPKAIHDSRLPQQVLSPVYVDQPNETTPYKHHHLPGSAMMHSPDEFPAFKHVGNAAPRIPVSHFNHWQGVPPFRPRSSLSSVTSLDGGRWPLNTRPYLRSPYQPVSFRQPPYNLVDPRDMAVRPGSTRCENTHPGMMRRENMQDYIADLERKVLGVSHDGDHGYRPPSAEVEDETRYLSSTFVPISAPTFATTAGLRTGEQVPWESQAAQQYVYPDNNSTSPANTYISHGYDGVGYGENRDHPVPLHHVREQPLRPESAMSGNVMAMYWKPNTYGL